MITNANVSLAIDIYLSYAKQSWYCPSTKQEEQSRYCLRAKLKCTNLEGKMFS